MKDFVSVVFLSIFGVVLGLRLGCSTVCYWSKKMRIFAYLLCIVVSAFFLVVFASNLKFLVLAFPFLFHFIGIVVGGEKITKKMTAPK